MRSQWDSSRQAFWQICLLNWLVFYDDVTSGLYTLSSMMFSSILFFRLQLSWATSIFVSSSVHRMCPCMSKWLSPFCSLAILLCGAFSTSVLFVGDVGFGERPDRFVIGPGYQSKLLYFCYRGIDAVCVPRPKLKVFTQRAEGLNGWREPATSV